MTPGTEDGGLVQDRLLAEITELTAHRAALDERLAAAVASARAANATWEDIGRAAGITRQSAHERWYRFTTGTDAGDHLIEGAPQR